MMNYTQIPIDFDVFKALTVRRIDAAMTENDVLRGLLGLPAVSAPKADDSPGMWLSDGVHFPVGTRVQHRFRDGRVVTGRIVATGVEVNGKVHAGFSPAALAAGGTHANGWNFWEVETRGRWVKATALRQ